jgi:hypothetical protein
MTPEERAKLFERTGSYREGYDDGKSAGIRIGRLQILLIVAIAAAAFAVVHYLF